MPTILRLGLVPERDLILRPESGPAQGNRASEARRAGVPALAPALIDDDRTRQFLQALTHSSLPAFCGIRHHIPYFSHSNLVN